ncbi:hypothetical protein K491DRAFT_722113 [Lophiostoma macrostomum CBS 122681]|uniref:Uncharacterized protein n=1 Tax=Lophiostoma macrostomum CBS 122681 TaxID=1314788 RepID=A0A6A6SPR9_9PLEO|nr:hypothetical protein K491DRAFT_722113 [Lophiostoma macrostomum CBS 122681]
MPNYPEGSHIRYNARTNLLPFPKPSNSSKPTSTARIVFAFTAPTVLQGKRIPASEGNPRYWIEDQKTRKCVLISENEVLGVVVEDCLDLKTLGRMRKARRGAVVGSG